MYNLAKISTPRYLFFLKQDGDTWTAIGSRKIDRIDIESLVEFEEVYTSMSVSQMFPMTQTISLNGKFRSFTIIQGNSPLAALGALIDALQKEEKEEEEQKAAIKQRQTDIARFGGEVDEELIRKVVKLRKKQEKKKKVPEMDLDQYEYERDLDKWDF